MRSSPIIITLVFFIIMPVAQAEDYIIGHFAWSKEGKQTKQQLMARYSKDPPAPGLAFPYPEDDYSGSVKTWNELVPMHYLKLSQGYVEMTGQSSMSIALYKQKGKLIFA